MPFTTNKGVRLHWDEQGSGTPILLVMGHSYSSKMWYPVIPGLAAKHRVITFDNRGTGESDTPAKWSLKDMASDGFAVMDAAGVDRAHIYGVSMGGPIVQEMVLQQPGRVRSLIVGCSGALTADKPRMPKWLANLYYLPPWVLKTIRGNRGGDGYGSAADRAAVAFDVEMIAKDKHSTRGVITQSHAIADYRTTREAIAGLTLPALVIHGDEDQLVPFKWGQELAEILPNSRFLHIPGAGHNYMMVKPDKSVGAVLEFMGEVDAGEGAAA
jgi:3-oxoadipate enol-lactonase